MCGCEFADVPGVAVFQVSRDLATLRGEGLVHVQGRTGTLIHSEPVIGTPVADAVALLARASTMHPATIGPASLCASSCRNRSAACSSPDTTTCSPHSPAPDSGSTREASSVFNHQVEAQNWARPSAACWSRCLDLVPAGCARPTPTCRASSTLRRRPADRRRCGRVDDLHPTRHRTPGVHRHEAHQRHAPQR